MAALDSGGFFSLPDSREVNGHMSRRADGFLQMAAHPCEYDSPGALTTVSYRGQTHPVWHNQGCGDAPPFLRAMEDRIDSTAGTGRFLRLRPEPRPVWLGCQRVQRRTCQEGRSLSVELSLGVLRVVGAGVIRDSAVWSAVWQMALND